jgi:glycerophosphoryl diester phosphodiesterase
MAWSVQVVGHRGAAGLLPENTLPSFERAIELGVDAVECDVRLTSDGRLVVIHDNTVDRTTNGSGEVAEMDLSAIQALDAGGGEPPPTLEQVLDLVAGRCGLYCELKANGTSGPAAEAVAARGLASDVLFISFSWERLVKVRDVIRGARLGLLVRTPREEDRTFAARIGFQGFGVHFRNVSLATVRDTHKAGMQLNVWTPNREADFEAMLALGVDVITTDRPDVLLALLGQTER